MTKRRIVLIALVLVLALGNVWWFTRDKPGPVPDFEFGVTTGAASFERDAAKELPRFDSRAGIWTSQGRRVPDIADHLRRFPGDGIDLGTYIAAGMAANASPEDMRSMLQALTKSRICYVAVVQDGDPAVTGSNGNEAYVAEIHRIVAVRGDDGTRIPCVERDQSPAAASSASR